MSQAHDKLKVKNVSKSPTYLAAPGYPKVALEPGQEHEFEAAQAKAFRPSAEAWMKMGVLEVSYSKDGKAPVAQPKQQPTPHDLEKDLQMDDAKVKSEAIVPEEPIQEEAPVEGGPSEEELDAPAEEGAPAAAKKAGGKKSKGK